MVVGRSTGTHDEYFAMLRRMLRALARRVGSADPEDLALMLDLRADLDRQIVEAVKAQRAAGFSWTEISRPLGMTRQAARQRWGDL